MIRRALAAAALLLGALAPFAGTRERHTATIDSSQLASIIAREEDHVTAVELAQWLRDQKEGLRLIDLRSAGEFRTFHLPRSERLTLEEVVSRKFDSSETIVLLSDGGAHAAQAWVLLQNAGHRRTFFLRGGVGEWLDDIVSPTLATNASPEERLAFQKKAALSRYFGGSPRIVADATSAQTVSERASAMRRRGC
jgi:rhodanese-related sulfurtransferase